MHGVHPKLDLFGVEVQVEEFPAPLCDRCGVPKWLNKRISYAGPPYSQVRLGVNPEINAVSSLLIGVVATGVIGVCLAQQRRRTPL